MSHQAGRYKAHLQSCTNFKTNKADAHRKLTAAEAGMGATWEGAAPGGSARSVTSSIAATSAYYMSMSAAHAEAVNVAYAEAVFASGGKFGYCTDDDEWAAFYSKLVGPVWLPPLRSLMSPKYVNTVFHKVDASMHAVLASLVGRFYQCDGWTGPNGEQLCFVRCSTPFLRVVVPDCGAPIVGGHVSLQDQGAAVSRRGRRGGVVADFPQHRLCDKLSERQPQRAD